MLNEIINENSDLRGSAGRRTATVGILYKRCGRGMITVNKMLFTKFKCADGEKLRLHYKRRCNDQVITVAIKGGFMKGRSSMKHLARRGIHVVGHEVVKISLRRTCNTEDQYQNGRNCFSYDRNLSQ